MKEINEEEKLSFMEGTATYSVFHGKKKFIENKSFFFNLKIFYYRNTFLSNEIYRKKKLNQKQKLLKKIKNDQKNLTRNIQKKKFQNDFQKINYKKKIPKKTSVNKN